MTVKTVADGPARIGGSAAAGSSARGAGGSGATAVASAGSGATDTSRAAATPTSGADCRVLKWATAYAQITTIDHARPRRHETLFCNAPVACSDIGASRLLQTAVRALDTHRLLCVSCG
jgi:hypothetical protein